MESRRRNQESDGEDDKSEEGIRRLGEDEKRAQQDEGMETATPRQRGGRRERIRWESFYSTLRDLILVPSESDSER